MMSEIACVVLLVAPQASNSLCGHEFLKLRNRRLGF
jgi:hypothetical protein